MTIYVRSDRERMSRRTGRPNGIRRESALGYIVFSSYRAEAMKVIAFGQIAQDSIQVSAQISWNHTRCCPLPVPRRSGMVT